MHSSLLLALTGRFAIAGRPDPEHSKNMTLFHINPLNASLTPANMDLGDAMGDLFFDFTTLQSEIECQKKRPSKYSNCDNKEAFGPNLGVTMVTVEVDQRFGAYGACNICQNGTSPLNMSHTCTGDEYVCDCQDTSSFPPKNVPCGANVGFERVKDFFGKKGIARFCLPLVGGSTCQLGTMAEKVGQLGGSWFSPLSLGRCDDSEAPCTWRYVRTEKRVHRECHRNSFLSAVEAHFKPGCVERCHDSGSGASRNVSSSCWSRCWMRAALGPQAARWPIRSDRGMSAEDLRNAWLVAFASEDPEQGGCPHVREAAAVLMV